MGISIRRVQRKRSQQLSYENRSIIRGLDRLCFPSDDPYEPRGSWWWIARDGENPVGYAGLKPLKDEPGVAFMSRVGVLPTHRGKGLGRRLVEVRVQFARSQPDIDTLITYTSPQNIASANNLISAGFRLYTPEYFWGLENGLYFRMDVKSH